MASWAAEFAALNGSIGSTTSFGAHWQYTAGEAEQRFTAAGTSGHGG
jgi:hypothetical protein